MIRIKKIKRLLSVALFAVGFALYLACSSVVPAWGNSAPSYWKTFPDSDILAVDQDSPIEVSNERLTFDFSQGYESRNEMSPVGRVTAEYRMTNPTDETLTVQMAFPFASSLNSLSTDEIAVKTDGIAAAFEIFIDPDEINAFGNLTNVLPSYSGALGDITNREWTLPGLDLEQEAKLYRFIISSDEEERLDFGVLFEADSQKTLLIGSDFEMVREAGKGKGELGVRIREKAEAEILALGQEPELTYEVRTSNGTRVSEERYQLKVVEESVDPKEYLLASIRSRMSYDSSAAISDTQLLNFCLRKIWEESQQYGYVPFMDSLDAVYNDRIFTLVWLVEFPPEAARTVSVSYLTEGGMDRRETAKPKYIYDYLLSPAKNWADFGSLEIEVITPPEAPYVIESSPVLTRAGKNIYSVRLDGLPDTELTFTLYEREKVTILDKAEKSIYSASYLIFFLWPFIVLILLFVVIAVIIKIIRRRRSR